MMDSSFTTLIGLVFFLTSLQQFPLKDLWTIFLQVGYQVRKNKLGGQQAWSYCKEWIGNNFDGTSLMDVPPTLKKLVQEHYHPLGNEDSQSTFTLHNLTLHNQTEVEHFLIQHFRLVHLQNFRLSPLKLLQVAFNAGQFQAECEKNTYDQLFVTFYREHLLDQYETFVGG